MMHSPVRLSFTSSTGSAVPQYIPKTTSLPTSPFASNTAPVFVHVHSSAHNSPKHAHKVMGVHRAKHQVEYANAPHTRHHLQIARSPVRVVRAPLPVNNTTSHKNVTANRVLPTQESIPDFFTYSPFDSAFPRFSAITDSKSITGYSFVNRTVNAAFSPAKRQLADKSFQQPLMPTTIPLTTQKSPSMTMSAIKTNPSAPKINNTNQTSTKKTESQTATPTNESSKRRLSGRKKRLMQKRLCKEHFHQIPKFVYGEKTWHLAGYVAYSPFDTSFALACKLASNSGSRVIVKNKKNVSVPPQVHHRRNHHPGHHPHGHHKANNTHQIRANQKDELLIQKFYEQHQQQMLPKPTINAIPGNSLIRAMATTPEPLPTPTSNSLMLSANSPIVSRAPFPRISPTATSSPATRPSFNIPALSAASGAGLFVGLPGSMLAIPTVTRAVSSNAHSSASSSLYPRVSPYSNRQVLSHQPSLLYHPAVRATPSVGASTNQSNLGSFSSFVW